MSKIIWGLEKSKVCNWLSLIVPFKYCFVQIVEHFGMWFWLNNAPVGSSLFIHCTVLCNTNMCMKYNVLIPCITCTVLVYTQQNSYSLSHLIGTVTTQWLDSDHVVTAVNCQQHRNFTVDQLFSHSAAINSDYTVTVQSLSSHCA